MNVKNWIICWLTICKIRKNENYIIIIQEIKIEMMTCKVRQCLETYLIGRGTKVVQGQKLLN